MKVIFTLVVLFTICFTALWGYSPKGNQAQNAPVELNSMNIHPNGQNGNENINNNNNENKLNVI